MQLTDLLTKEAIATLCQAFGVRTVFHEKHYPHRIGYRTSLVNASCLERLGFDHVPTKALSQLDVFAAGSDSEGSRALWLENFLDQLPDSANRDGILPLLAGDADPDQVITELLSAAFGPPKGVVEQ